MSFCLFFSVQMFILDPPYNTIIGFRQSLDPESRLLWQQMQTSGAANLQNLF